MVETLFDSFRLPIYICGIIIGKIGFFYVYGKIVWIRTESVLFIILSTKFEQAVRLIVSI